MGPAERAAVAAVRGNWWPGNPTARRLAKAAVLAGRAVDAGAGWYPYAGRVEQVYARIMFELLDCGPVSDKLDELRADHVVQQVIGCSDKRRAEKAERMRELGFGPSRCGVSCGCGSLLSDVEMRARMEGRFYDPTAGSTAVDTGDVDGDGERGQLCD